MSERPWETEWSFERDLQGGGQGLVSILVNKQDSTRLGVVKTIVPRWRNDSQAHERMRQEIDTLKKLRAANARVPEVYDSYLEHTDSEPFVLMSYIKGPRLDEWIKANAPASPATACVLTKAVSETIHKCHQLSIGHRDLKPANIILLDGQIEEPYVIDFGISFDSKQTAYLTKAGEIFRNEFMTLPECQDLTGGHRDLRSDITALAGLFFMCLTGTAPIVLRDAQEATPHKRHESLIRKAATTSEQAERLAWFFDRAFAYPIAERFQQLEEFLKELEQFGSSVNPDSINLNSELALLEKTLQQKDRGVQLAALRRKYVPIRKQLEQEIYEQLHQRPDSPNNAKNMGIEKGVVAVPVSVGDLLETDSIATFAIIRPDFPTSAAAMFAAFAVGMDIHIYSTSFCVPSNQLSRPPNQPQWSKVAVIYDADTSISRHTLSLVAEDLKSKLAREVRNLTRKISGLA